ncbi:amidase [Massilia sp. P8910]|uniref:amidase n=1 Tax=Massilia antarctica TaxID=2765360 RepID=UPI001E4BA67B|nr:amidase [Massilia antarctica]
MQFQHDYLKNMIIPFASATDTASLLASGEVCALELVDFMVARIVKLDPQINAVVVRDFEQARRAAASADAALKRGIRRPLLGVPVTVKESFHVAGLATSWGIGAFRDWPCRTESVAIQRLKHAGAIIVGKTNIATALADWQCDNELFGKTSNPWDPCRTPGGSSGGSAAALAAGLSFLELGSDLAGSIRIPAHFCGVYGHRPTQGLISSQGYCFPGTTATSDLGTIGPMARSADDLRCAIDLLAGPGSPESIGWRFKMPAARHDRVQGFRILLLDSHPLVPSSDADRQQLDTLATELRKLGATVATESPLLPSLAEAAHVFMRILIPQNVARLSEEHYAAALESIHAIAEDDTSLMAVGLRACIGNPRDGFRANEARVRLKLQWQRLFRDWDVVVCPVSPTAAFAHDDRPMEDRRLSVDGLPISYFDQMAWISFASLCGLPATSVPCGLNREHMPNGLQIIGPHYEDHTTLAFASHLERHFGGFVPPPRFAGH